MGESVLSPSETACFKRVHFIRAFTFTRSPRPNEWNDCGPEELTPSDGKSPLKSMHLDLQSIQSHGPYPKQMWLYARICWVLWMSRQVLRKLRSQLDGLILVHPCRHDLLLLARILQGDLALHNDPACELHLPLHFQGSAILVGAPNLLQ